MTYPSSGAVFLSYASQDAGAAQRISEALQAAGVEAWFDESGLKGGAAWDAEIRRQIRDCALFMPIISANTESRLEGYFRLEWRLAEQRTHLMALGKPFLVPVVIDGTPDDDAHVPNAFLDVQWTRLPGGERAGSFAAHVKGLLAQTGVPSTVHVHDHPGGALAGKGTAAPAKMRHHRSRMTAGLVLAALLLGIGGSLWLWATKRAGQSLPATGAAVAAQAAPAAPRTAVAVLPFTNLTGDPGKEYLGDGMAEEVINTLNKVPGLKVPARTSTFAYKNRSTDIRQIAGDLNVGTILQGSVRAAGKRIRIAVQLINAQDSLALWSQSYDEEFTDLFKLQDKLATQIATALQPNLSEAAQAAVAQGPPTPDVEAYNSYLQGWALIDKPSEANLKQAVAYFQQAIDRDPQFARAYAGIAEAHSNWARLTWRPAEHSTAAVRFARKALALDPQLASARNALAMTAGSRVQLLEMEAHSQMALASDANDGWVHTIRASSLMNTGHVREALAEAQEGYALAPANPAVVANLAFFHAAAGRDAEARKFAESAVAMGYPKESSPLHVVNALTALRAGRYADVAKNWTGPSMGLEFASSPAAEITRLVFAALADPARRDVALAARDRLYPKSAAIAVVPAAHELAACLQSSWMYAYFGTVDVAYDLANQCLDQFPDGQVMRLVHLWTPELRTFRRDPRFQALATRLGLMEYWQQYGPPDDCELKDGKLICQ